MIKDDFMKHREYLGKTTFGDVDYHEYVNTVNNTIEYAVISEDSIRGIERFIKELEMNACRLKEKNTVKSAIKNAMIHVLGEDVAKTRFEIKEK